MKNNLMTIYHRSPRFIQTLGINIYELKEWNQKNSRRFLHWLKFLRETERWDHTAFIQYQNKYLKHILQYAYENVPFYHELYKKNNIDISKIKTIDNLEKLPIVRKEDIVQYRGLFFPTKKEKSIIGHTSGTTGKPITVKISRDLKILNKANAYRRDLWAGYDRGWIARFVGDTPVKDCNNDQLFRSSYFMKRAIFPTYCLSMGTFPSIFNNLKKLHIKFLQCYPSAGYLLAKYLEHTDEYFPLTAVLYSSEPMYDFQRELIEDRFQTKVFGYYGQAEEVISALECEKGKYHLTMIDGVLEIVKNGEKINPGEKGFTVVTSLHNYAMPFIRYALDDYTGYINEECDCSRLAPLMYPVETKLRDFIITPTGKIISPCLLGFPIKTAQNIIESQYIQKTIDTINVKIIKADNYTSSNELALLQALKQLLGDEMVVKIEYVKKIYQTASYKKRFVINEIGKDYIENAFEKLQ